MPTLRHRYYRLIDEYALLDILKDYDPVVVGTFPIDIYVENSDIDIACCANDLAAFGEFVRNRFSQYQGFADNMNELRYVASFGIERMPVEIYAEAIPSRLQYAYRHMVIEDRLLRLGDENFRSKIIELKKQGQKTEPAFGMLLGFNEPYSELLLLEKLSDEELLKLL